MKIALEPMLPVHWEAVRAIYIEGMETGNATFETDAPSWDQWDRAHLPNCRIVANAEDQIGGWAALSPVSARAVYAGVAEVSLYVAAWARGMGVGKKTLGALIEESEKRGIWTLQAGIFVENVASLYVHENAGFRVVGMREKIGQQDGKWRNVMLLERRSRVVGI